MSPLSPETTTTFTNDAYSSIPSLDATHHEDDYGYETPELTKGTSDNSLVEYLDQPIGTWLQLWPCAMALAPQISFQDPSSLALLGGLAFVLYYINSHEGQSQQTSAEKTGEDTNTREANQVLNQPIGTLLLLWPCALAMAPQTSFQDLSSVALIGALAFVLNRAANGKL